MVHFLAYLEDYLVKDKQCLPIGFHANYLGKVIWCIESAAAIMPHPMSVDNMVLS